ncbi:deoxyribodipyrimidine photo-lyase [Corynebacterium callunae]|uniref:cryptochrome/photolyase family protein n=1 Tax=Corynebacterium callunae TaxID=1721 RepID=UPI003981BA23
MALTIIWVRDDLRIADNPALDWARAHGEVAAVFIREQHPQVRPLGAAAKWWQERSLYFFEAALAAQGMKLWRLEGDPTQLLPELVASLGASAVTWNRRYHQPLCSIDAAIKAQLASAGIEVRSHAGFLLNEPWEIKTGQGTSYKVFSPFAKKAFEQAEVQAQSFVGGREVEAGTGFEPGVEAGFEAGPGWQQQLAAACHPGESAAQQKLADFIEFLSAGGDYATGRDHMEVAATSGLSPHLRFGELSIHRVWWEISTRADSGEIHPAAARAFLNELLWRDFSWHRLYEHPTMHQHNIRTTFDNFPWEWDAQEARDLRSTMEDPRKARGTGEFHEVFAAWRSGQTGIALVDAGMRELWATGTMHNRARMVVASFLTKNLLIHWRHGEEWFWDTLVDADHAANAFNWQWVAGCGDDAAPYFRIFNPETQAQKFDPEQTYIRRWIAEYGTPAYPAPIVDLPQSRRAALAAYQAMG